MIAIGSRQRTQPPPPRVVFEALCEPDRDRCRPWLSVNLLEDEQLPSVLRKRMNRLINADLRFTFGQ